jgi:hypothetical protein
VLQPLDRSLLFVGGLAIFHSPLLYGQAAASRSVAVVVKHRPWSYLIGRLGMIGFVCPGVGSVPGNIGSSV